MKRWLFVFKNLLMKPLDSLKRNQIHLSVRLSKNTTMARSKVGQHTYIGPNANIINTEIGSYCSIAPGVQIGGMEHSHWWLSMSTTLSDQCSSDKKVTIGNDVWIAAGSIVRQGVSIGDGAVIGAMSLVTKDVPPNTVWYGVPAKCHRARMDEDTFEKLQATRYWEKGPGEAKAILADLDRSLDQ